MFAGPSMLPAGVVDEAGVAVDPEIFAIGDRAKPAGAAADVQNAPDAVLPEDGAQGRELPSVHDMADEVEETGMVEGIPK
jgi:hypothetical protein